MLNKNFRGFWSLTAIRVAELYASAAATEQSCHFAGLSASAAIARKCSV
jgi:hypothetical protein